MTDWHRQPYLADPARQPHPASPALPRRQRNSNRCGSVFRYGPSRPGLNHQVQRPTQRPRAPDLPPEYPLAAPPMLCLRHYFGQGTLSCAIEPFRLGRLVLATPFQPVKIGLHDLASANGPLRLLQPLRSGRIIPCPPRPTLTLASHKTPPHPAKTGCKGPQRVRAQGQNAP